MPSSIRRRREVDGWRGACERCVQRVFINKEFRLRVVVYASPTGKVCLGADSSKGEEKTDVRSGEIAGRLATNVGAEAIKRRLTVQQHHNNRVASR